MHLHLLLPAALLPAVLLGELARRLRIPSLTGEILAGVLLGPAVVGFLPSSAHDPETFETLQGLAQIGLCALLFRMGLETRLEKFLAEWRQSLLLAIVGILTSFLFGWSLTLLAGWTPLSAVFVGATLTATSIGTTAAILTELRAERSTAAALLLGAALVGDVIGLLFLSMLSGLGAPVSVELLYPLLLAVGFIVLGVLLGPLAVNGVVLLSRWLGSSTALLVLAFSYLLLLAYAAKAAGLAMVVGAYAAGLAFSRHAERERLEKDVRPIIDLLRPLFFILVGSTIAFSALDPGTLSGRKAIAYTLGLFALAVLGKMVGGLLLHTPGVSKLAVGCGMVARGGMGFVFAQIGLGAGAIPADLYSSVAIVLTATTIVGPVLLRLTLKPSPPVS